MMVKVRKDLTGQVFGRLTVLEQTEDYVNPNGAHYAQWLCKCSCGNPDNIVVQAQHLKSGHTQSCGCLTIEKTIEANKKHNRIEYRENYCVGWTTNTNVEFYFDITDKELVEKYTWCERITQNGYHALVGYDQENKKTISMHHLFGYKEYDHIDRNPMNNRRNNLRKCSHQQNSYNVSVRKNNSSGVTGVSWNKKRQVWEAYIRCQESNNGSRTFLGYYNNLNDAVYARLQAEKKYMKEFAPQKHLFEQYGINTTQNYLKES